MAHKLKEKGVAKPATIFGLTTLAVAGSGFFATTAEASTTHTVRAGEFLQLIGQRHGVSINQLRQWNNLQTDVLQIGQELIVSQPGSNNGGGTSASGTRVVTASRLNVRSGAGTNHAVIGGLNRNTTVTVTGFSNGWYTINHNGRTGFISADFVSEQGGSTGASNSSATTPASGTRTVTASRLNVRSGAGTNHAVIGSLSRNQTVTVTGFSNGWYTINHNGRTGFISADFVTEGTGSSSNTGSTPASGTVVVTANSLNVRSGAGTNHGVIGSLSRNQTVTVTGHSNGWYTINHNGRTGHISANFVTEQTNASSNASANNNTGSTPASGTRVVTANRLNVRSGAGTSHGVIGSLSRNQTVTVTGRSNGWYTINHNGRTGHISADFVTEGTGSSNNTNASNNQAASTSFDTQRMISFARQFVGVPYVWGGTTPSGFDCSGFIHFVLNQNGVSIGRTNVAGYWSHSRFQTVSNPQPGDLIFFQNTWTRGPSHMGIMVNNTQFIHASSSRGVTISDISNTFWRQHFLGYRRIR